MRNLLASTLILSSVLFPAVANASSTTDDAAAPTPAVRISTGVTAPVLVKNIDIQLPDGISKSFISPETEVALSLTVDSNGQPQNVKVIKPANPYWDARVVDAIQKSHFRPGTVDNTPIPVEMTLTVTLAH
jgi:TonB family protein